MEGVLPKPNCITRKGCTSTRIKNARPLAIARASKPHLVFSSITSNLLAAGSALALTTPSISDLKKYQEEYERAAEKAAEKAAAEAAKVASQIQLPDVPSVDVSTIDASSVGDATPLIAGLAVGIAIAGAGIALLFGSKGPKVQGISAAKAIDMLASDPSAELLDIRTQAEIKESGSPDLRSVKKPIITLPYVPTTPGAGGTIVLGWADKLRRSRKVTEETTIILLSTYTPESLAAAKLVTEVYPESSAVYYVVDGTEGPKGWKTSGLPWREPVKLPIDFGVLKSLDLTGVAAGTEKIVKKYQESPTLVNGAVAAVAVAAASVFLFTEMETILELVGVVAALQFLASKLLFAEDRQQTFRDLKTLITEKIAANEAGQDLQQLASTILDVDTVEEVAQISSNLSNGKNGSANGAADNVKEAREWIARWRAKNSNPAVVRSSEFVTK